ncbi:nuclear transport factor 2 family protein [Kordiimonas sp. SCSIO 12610]|uniref:YybH family protein n=1 Tax=Kordiimonas sp. SCSIO 12610 TaxID=2829597 RepID=UPI0021087AD5|nr:nuclear transport factor 2 family protein [Kordiimonas sp. SCSIO 12610]UTW54088.1 nuclear transport factor 2 family protein [Kordiimonas sp. SCSIO 12610]
MYKLFLKPALLVGFFAMISLSITKHVHAEEGAETVQTSSVNNTDTIRNLMNAWLTAYNSKDIDALMRLYSDKIYYANNGSNLQRNKSSIGENYQQQFSAAPNTRIDFKEELVSVNSGVGYIAGKYKVIIPADDAATRYFFGRVLLIFEQNPNHSVGMDGWELVVDFDNQGADVSLDKF